MTDEFEGATKIATVPEMMDRIRHDGKMMKRIIEQRDIARAEADLLRKEVVDLLIELDTLKRTPLVILEDGRIGIRTP